MQNHPVLYYLKYKIKLEILSVNNIKLLSSILLIISRISQYHTSSTIFKPIVWIINHKTLKGSFLFHININMIQDKAYI